MNFEQAQENDNESSREHPLNDAENTPKRERSLAEIAQERLSALHNRVKGLSAESMQARLRELNPDLPKEAIDEVVTNQEQDIRDLKGRSDGIAEDTLRKLAALAETTKKTLTNLPGSAYRLGKETAADTINTLTHPIESAKTIGTITLGGIEKLIPGDQPHEPVFDQTGAAIKIPGVISGIGKIAGRVEEHPSRIEIIETENVEERPATDTMESSTKKTSTFQKETDLKDFTKKYSSEERSRVARDIRQLREEYFRQKQADTIQNKQQELVRETSYTRIDTTKEKISKIQADLRSLEIALHERKESLMVRIMDLINKKDKQNLLKEKTHQEQILEQAQEELENEERFLAEAADIVTEDTLLRQSKQELDQFYQEQSEIKSLFETQSNQRSVREIAVKNQALIIHAMPLRGGKELLSIDDVGHTAHNNESIDVRSMDDIQRVGTALGLGPTISASSVRLEHVSKDPLFFPSGLLLAEGNVLSAYPRDAATKVDNVHSKHAKYDQELRSSIMDKDFEEKLNMALQRDNGPEFNEAGRFNKGHNELVIEKPIISGLVMPLDIRYHPREIARNLKYLEDLSKVFGLPVYGIREGKILDLQQGGKEISIEDALAIKEQPDASKRLQYIQNAIESGAISSGQAKNRFLSYSQAKHLQIDQRSFVIPGVPYALQADNLDSLLTQINKEADRMQVNRNSLIENKRVADAQTWEESLDNISFFLLGLREKDAGRTPELITKINTLLEKIGNRQQKEKFLEKRLDVDGNLQFLSEDLGNDIKQRMQELGMEGNQRFPWQKNKSAESDTETRTPEFEDAKIFDEKNLLDMEAIRYRQYFTEFAQGLLRRRPEIRNSDDLIREVENPQKQGPFSSLDTDWEKVTFRNMFNGFQTREDIEKRIFELKESVEKAKKIYHTEDFLRSL